MKIRFITPLLLVSSTSFCDINMRDASFLKRDNDFSHPIFARTYSSRSVWKGIFGYGWCAQFEKSLEILNSKEGLLKECDRTRPVQIQKQNQLWSVQIKTFGTASFNSKGQFVEFKNPKASLVQLFYQQDGALAQIQSENASSNFRYDPKTQALSEIQSGKKTLAYQFLDGNLIQVRNGKKTLQTLKYDSAHNLTEAQRDSEVEKIEYDAQTDEVTSYQDARGCFEQYHFQRVSDLEYKSQMTRKCPASRLFGQAFSFKAQRTPQGTLVLTEIRKTGGLLEKSSLP